MAKQSTTLHCGQVVTDVNGEELGTVSALWPYVPASEPDVPPTPGHLPPEPDNVGYFRIDQKGVLGVPMKHLYVPFRAVMEVQAEDKATLSCAKEECQTAYCERPWFVDRDIG